MDDQRHLGRAASSLKVAQPAVSLTLGQLEQSLALRLVERTPRGVVHNASRAGTLGCLRQAARHDPA